MSSNAAIVLLLLLIAGVAVFFWRQEHRQRRQWENNCEQQRHKNTELETIKAVAEEKLNTLQGNEQKLNQLRVLSGQQQTRIAELETQLENEKNNNADKLKLLQQVEEKLYLRLEDRTQKILEEKSSKLSTDNKTQLDPLLAPLKENIDGFRRKIEDLYNESTKERTTLQVHIEKLQENTNRLSSDANNLADALKGSGKMQGDWGEVLLIKLLENSGLTKGEHYDFQKSLRTEEGEIQRPDVIINLPDDKHLIIDAKVSLSNYVDYSNASNEEARKTALKQHLEAVKAHINSLHLKDYSKIIPDSPSFVLMFMALEPAYLLALQNDHQLFTDAYTKKNVILTGPTTLIPILRTVANIWRIEKQQQHVQDIVKQGGKLYDKFAGFVADLEEVGENLDKTQKAHASAKNKLCKGHGNLLGQAEKLKQMGIEPSKELPQNMVERALEHEPSR